MRISLTTILLSLVIILHAQTYSGRVADKDGSPLAGANVTGVNQEGRIACYALADAEGRFRITVPEGKAVTAFSFSYIGYTKRSIPIAEMKEGMTVRLSVGEVKLKEVKVTGQRIKAAGDTLIYSVNAFRHEQDRTIADVLKKMPGIEVKSGGTIEYQGVPITELKIEGMNLMGRQYAMASNNLSAKKVKSVQVLRNHQPVRSLRGVKFSDDTALNLILTDDARGEWITSADLSLGLSLPDSHDDGDTRLLYDCRLISMCFAHKYQTLMMYKNNSTGKDISLELQDVASMRRPQPHEGGLTHLMGEPSARVGRERHTFNDTHILAANGLAKLSETQQLRLQASLLSDKHESLSSTSTTYLTLDDKPVVMEQVDITNNYSVLKAELNYEYNSPSTYLRSNTRGYADWNKSEGITTVNQSTSERLVKPRKRYISEDIELSHTSKSGHVTSFSSYTTYDYLPSQLLTINDLWQNLTLKSLTTNNEVQQKIRVAGQYMNARMGINHTTLDIDVSMSGDGTGQETHTAERRRHQTTDLYLHPSFSLALGSHDIEAGVRLSFMHQTYSEATADDFTACPVVAWTWRPTIMTKLRLRYTYAAQARQSAAIYDTPIFTNYRNVTVNAGTPDVQRTQQLSAAFEFNSPIKGLFFYIQPRWSRVGGNILYTTSLDNDIFIQTATDEESSATTLGLSAKAAKTFRTASLYLALSGSVRRTSYDLLVGDRMSEAHTTSSSATLTYSTKPASILSIEGNSTVLFSRQANSTMPQCSAGSTTSWEHSLSLNLHPAERWIVSVANDLYHSSDKQIPTNYFLNASVTYHRKKYELCLTANNILGTSRYERRLITSTVERYSTIRLRPRDILLRVSFDI